MADDPEDYPEHDDPEVAALMNELREMIDAAIIADLRKFAERRTLPEMIELDDQFE